MSDPIADMLIQIKNAQMVHTEHVILPASKMKFKIAIVLKREGYISDATKKKRKAKKSEHEYLNIKLRYNKKEPAISGIRLISKPSRRIYIQAQQIKPVRSGFGIAILSTSKGILTSKEARQQNTGGQVLFEIW